MKPAPIPQQNDMRWVEGGKEQQSTSFTKASGKSNTAIRQHCCLQQHGERAQTVTLVSIPAQRDRKVEDGEHERPSIFGEEISNDGGCNGGVTGFANADQASGQDEQPKGLWTERNTHGPKSVRSTLLLFACLRLQSQEGRDSVRLNCY